MCIRDRAGRAAGSRCEVVTKNGGGVMVRSVTAWKATAPLTTSASMVSGVPSRCSSTTTRPVAENATDSATAAASRPGLAQDTTPRLPDASTGLTRVGNRSRLAAASRSGPGVPAALR